MARSNRRRLFSRQFKLEAVELSKDPTKSVKEHAADLGIHHSNLHRWRQQYLQPDGEVAEPENTEVKVLQAEIRELKKKLARTEQEREFLKKAAAYFANDPNASASS